MRAVDKAIWYIENHYREPISLDAAARVAGVSRYHLSRIFCYQVGQPFSRYLRTRRLTRAAIELAAGQPDILDLALSLGYGSHEAFTRAFKEHFQRTPEQVRSQGHTDDLELTEARSMKPAETRPLNEPRHELLGSLTIIGLSRHYPFDKVGGIPDQWQTFAPMIPRIRADAARAPTTYGVIYNGGDDSFDYLSGVALAPGTSSPENLVRLDIAPRSYLVFTHAGHVATLRDTCNAIWSDWLPGSDQSIVEAPWFERYGAGFDPHTGEGGVEIWIPVAGRG